MALMPDVKSISLFANFWETTINSSKFLHMKLSTDPSALVTLTVIGFLPIASDISPEFLVILIPKTSKNAFRFSGHYL